MLFLVDAAGNVGNVVPISSGSGKDFHENGYPATRAVTPCGRLEVYAKVTGWKKSPLGVMHNPMYIVGGIAIHGSEDMRDLPRQPRLHPYPDVRLAPPDEDGAQGHAGDRVRLRRRTARPPPVAVEARRTGGD